MPIFDDNNKYQYWNDRIATIWVCKDLAIDPILYTLIDARAISLLSLLSQLHSRLDAWVDVDEFSRIPLTYEDLKIALLVVNDYLGIVKLEMSAYKIRLKP